MEVDVKEWDDDCDEEGAVGYKREDGEEAKPAKACPVPRRRSKTEEGRMDMLATHEGASKTGRVGGKRRFKSRGEESREGARV